jgi:hypothetical protein
MRTSIWISTRRDETCGAEIDAQTYRSCLDLTPLPASLPLRPILTPRLHLFPRFLTPSFPAFSHALPRSPVPHPSDFISTSLLLFPPSRIFPLRIFTHTSNCELNTDIFAVHSPPLPILPPHLGCLWPCRCCPLGGPAKCGEGSGVGGVGALRGWGGALILLFVYGIRVWVGCFYRGDLRLHIKTRKLSHHEI